MPEIKFFKSQSDFRKWLSKNHDKKTELMVGYYKKSTGKPSIDWPQSVDEALCFGWIDGIRKKIDEESYTIRFTPRRPGSNWSTVNINRVSELSKLGLMTPAGLKAFSLCDEVKSKQYSYEARNRGFDPAFESKLKANKKAWVFFKAQAPYYQKTAAWWVISAKKEETRLKRLNILIKDSETGLKIAPLRQPVKSK